MDSIKIARLIESQNTIVKILDQLTTAGKAIWLKREIDPGFVYCFIECELFLFRYRYVDEDPDSEIVSITAEIRNETFLWLPDLQGWNEVDSLMALAKIDDEQMKKMKEKCLNKIISDLELLNST